ncbi:LacI family DNA-binding transcriptional regulator [Gallaecimonas kandeliae]|uniref:LacI family DNA-binding transcriptional regulator n=1 Tax=Gallaecimonas kandeliae TaxID=3029055 RepID=UPI002646FD31|nr:LacI family DNA-binding transcriptional regulator [Gallaecimonas kandeliae]WKE66162.1 LacI family DNA-binding transcriptional regulator [Gallaecimonas kandeliae]
MKTATINDVARLAGVSIKTVSRVINREPRVREETVARVMEAARQLDYQPNQAARSLAGVKSFNIGYLYDNPNAYYVIDMQNGLLAACRDHGYELLIHPCDAFTGHIAEELTATIKRARLAGVVLTPPLSELPEVVATLAEQQVPLVRILSGSQAPDQLSPCVMVDDRGAAFEITEHLLNQGHRKLAFFCGDTSHQSTAERQAGFEEALKAQGLAPSAAQILPGRYAFDSGVANARQVLQGPDRPTAIVAANDEIAAGALFACRLEGVQVPQEIAIAGFEDSPFSRQTWPPLTTAQQPNSLIARRAAELLLAGLRGEKKDKSLIFKPKLLVRESTQQPG